MRRQATVSKSISIKFANSISIFTMNTNPLFELGLTTYKTIQQLKYETIVDLFIHAPQYYSAWWGSLLKDAPQHLVIETGLIVFIIWLMFIRKTVDPAKSSKNDSLSKKETDWLIETWQPEPLVADALSEKDAIISNNMMVGTVFAWTKCCLQLLTFMLITYHRLSREWKAIIYRSKA